MLGSARQPRRAAVPPDRRFQPGGGGIDGEDPAGMAIERAFVVHGEPGWDEPTPVGRSRCSMCSPAAWHATCASPGISASKPCSAGGSRGRRCRAQRQRRCARCSRAAIEGAHRDALLIGAALALELMGREHDPREAVARAAVAIDSGRARELLEKLVAIRSTSLMSGFLREMARSSLERLKQGARGGNGEGALAARLGCAARAAAEFEPGGLRRDRGIEAALAGAGRAASLPPKTWQPASARMPRAARPRSRC